MAGNTRATSLLIKHAKSASPSASRCVQARYFSANRPSLIDGVYQELTSMRTRTSFIEALRKQQEDLKSTSTDPSKSASKERPQRDVTPRSMAASEVKVVLPLARDPWLLDSYINASGHIRLGSLFMDLDAISGVCAYKHTGDDVMTVTAAVDRITLKRPLTSICDLELSGRVTFATGRSSMEISMQVAKAPEEGKSVQEEDILMTCAFTMVSLDPTTKKPVAISPLTTSTAEEERLFAQGQEHYNRKNALSKSALKKQTPNDEESDLIHALWLKQLSYGDPLSGTEKPETARSMSSTAIHSVQIMQPQYRNRHNFMIFGGFLLKSTFELAFTCASAVSHARPTFVALDPSTFANPVPVGSVLYLTATVAYTDLPLVSGDVDVKESPTGTTRMQVRVDSKIRDVEHGIMRPTGQFNYTFQVDRDITVIPETYSQFMMYLDARRRSRHVEDAYDVVASKESVME